MRVRRNVLVSSAVAGASAGLLFGFVLAGDLPIREVPRPVLIGGIALLAIPSALSGAWFLLSVEPVGWFGFWRGVFATLVSWVVFCLALSVSLQILSVPPGWVYGGGVFVLGSVFILPFLLVFGGMAGLVAGRGGAS